MIWFVVCVIYLLLILFVWSLVAVNPREEDDVSGADSRMRFSATRRSLIDPADRDGALTAMASMELEMVNVAGEFRHERSAGHSITECFSNDPSRG
jgi:hypothetical protein